MGSRGRVKTWENQNLLIHITTVVFGSVAGERDDMICLR